MEDEALPVRRKAAPPPPRGPPPPGLASTMPPPRSRNVPVPKGPPPISVASPRSGGRRAVEDDDGYNRPYSSSRQVPAHAPPPSRSSSNDTTNAALRWRMKRQGSSSMGDTDGTRRSSFDDDNASDVKNRRYGGGSGRYRESSSSDYKRGGRGAYENDDVDSYGRDGPRTDYYSRGNSRNRDADNRDNYSEYGSSSSSRRRQDRDDDDRRGERYERERDYDDRDRDYGVRGSSSTRSRREEYDDIGDEGRRASAGITTAPSSARRTYDEEEDYDRRNPIRNVTKKGDRDYYPEERTAKPVPTSPVVAVRPKVVSPRRAPQEDDEDTTTLRKEKPTIPVDQPREKPAGKKMITIRQQSSSGEELFGGGPEEVEADVSAAPVSQTKHKQNSADDDNAETMASKPKLIKSKSKKSGAAATESSTTEVVDAKDELSEKTPRKRKSKGKDKAEEKGTIEHSLSNLSTTSKSKPLGISPRVYDTNEIPMMLKELLQFICLPFERSLGVVMRCFIERSRSLTNPLSPVYTLYADNENQSGRMLMCARKVVKSQTPYYVFSLNPEDLTKPRSERSAQYLGKLRGNSGGTEYVLYDDGQSPDDFNGDDDGDDDGKDGKVDRTRLRRELGVIYYNYGLTSDQGRKVEVTIPKITPTGDELGSLAMEIWQPSNPRQSITEAFKRVRFQGGQNVLENDRIMVLHQRESRYDPLSSCLVDFKGRATAASVKNFQLIKSFPEDREQRDIYYGPTGEGRNDVYDPDAPAPVYLQMGRVGRDCFNMDLQHPLSVFQAFAICISRFDTKSHW